MTTQMKETTPRIPDTWFELIEKIYDLRPVKTKKAYHQAMQALRAMMRLQPRNKDQSDYLKSLSVLIGEYESKACQIEISSDPVENLKFLLKENNLTASDLGRMLGDRSLGSRLLSGGRSLSKNHIRVLSERFRVSPALFI
ncbi:MAG: DNA-binding protein [Phycisphaerae bacterium]|nr:DNA-binding protein [Phycisphaerae bacterium]